MVIMFGEIRNLERGAGVGKKRRVMGSDVLNLRYLFANL